MSDRPGPPRIAGLKISAPPGSSGFSGRANPLQIAKVSPAATQAAHMQQVHGVPGVYDAPRTIVAKPPGMAVSAQAPTSTMATNFAVSAPVFVPSSAAQVSPTAPEFRPSGVLNTFTPSAVSPGPPATGQGASQLGVAAPEFVPRSTPALAAPMAAGAQPASPAAGVPGGSIAVAAATPATATATGGAPPGAGGASPSSVPPDFTSRESMGGTTYFFAPGEQPTPEELQAAQAVAPEEQLFNVYTSAIPSTARLPQTADTFFIREGLREEVLVRNSLILAKLPDTGGMPPLPAEVEAYHTLMPLDEATPDGMSRKMFGHPTHVYKALSLVDGMPYVLRRVENCRLSSEKAISAIDRWTELQHPNVVSLREAFTTHAFGDYSLVLVYDYHPGAETMLSRHFTNRPDRHLVTELLLWSYIIQLSSALRAIHKLQPQGLACRTVDPTKILLVGKSRIRLNCVGLFDVVSYDQQQEKPSGQVLEHYKQEDLMALGRLVLALACNTLNALQRDNLSQSLDYIRWTYSQDLSNVVLYLLSSRIKTVDDLMPMIGDRFYAEIRSADIRCDLLQGELVKEVENGRLFRLLSKIMYIVDRQDLKNDTQWSDTGDRFIIKLFKDFMFGQTSNTGAPWVDLAHVVQCLNKMDAGFDERIVLMSRDEQSQIIVTYRDIKRCLLSSFHELMNAQ